MGALPDYFFFAGFDFTTVRLALPGAALARALAGAGSGVAGAGDRA